MACTSSSVPAKSSSEPVLGSRSVRSAGLRAIKHRTVGGPDTAGLSAGSRPSSRLQSSLVQMLAYIESGGCELPVTLRPDVALRRGPTLAPIRRGQNSPRP